MKNLIITMALVILFAMFNRIQINVNHSLWQSYVNDGTTVHYTADGAE